MCPLPTECCTFRGRTLVPNWLFQTELWQKWQKYDNYGATSSEELNSSDIITKYDNYERWAVTQNEENAYVQVKSCKVKVLQNICFALIHMPFFFVVVAF